MARASGILLPIFSLPSPYGIGAFGRDARAFVDFLASAGQKYWQVLPLGPTGYGDSPYQALSSHAGNPNFIDLGLLCCEGLLDEGFLAGFDWGDDPARVDYAAVNASHRAALNRAFETFCQSRERCAALAAFRAENESWLTDYALYAALKDRYGGAPWTDWPDGARTREEDALGEFRRELTREIEFHAFTQYEFFSQWRALKAYANARGVRVIGDVPIYVPLDSADVWARRDVFLLDENGVPAAVAGVPPDFFTVDGQLWGNPLYDWGALARDGYRWWLDRLRAAAELFDAVRFDHFRGLSSYWRVPYGETTARNGEWMSGPGLPFIDAVKAALPELMIIAEDLGYLTPDVLDLLAASGFPGMKVLQFAFDAREPSCYLPHTYERRCVCYTGTHDNTTAAAFFSEAAPDDVAFAVEYLALTRAEGYVTGLLRGGSSSVADLFVAQMQDWLELGADARTNVPGTLGGRNWQWRMPEGAADEALAARIAEMTRRYGR